LLRPKSILNILVYRTGTMAPRHAHPGSAVPASQPDLRPVWFAFGPQFILSVIDENAVKTRLAGLGLIGLGVLFAVLFLYFPIRDGPEGVMGRVRLNVLVFIPLAVVTGLAFVAGGPPVLAAFQARPKSGGQLALVLSIIIGSGILTGLGYWQLKTRWLRAPEPVILDSAPRRPPDLPNVR
jgi:hypothetical protein